MQVKIKDNIIGSKCPVFIVAEISANHGQDFNRAVELIKKAKESGVNAVKFQTYTPDILTIDADSRYFRIKHPKWKNQTLYQLYKKAYTPWNWFKRLKKITEDLGLVFFSTAFDKTSVDFLEELNVPLHKVASFELVDLPLIEYMAKSGKPIIMSTGMASVSEIKEAIKAAKDAGAKDIILLKCVSGYPAEPIGMNLKTIPDMERRFNVPIGLSDHTLGIGVSVCAVSLGASVIEKHFTLSRRTKTADSFFSIEPQELKGLVENIRTAESALGKVYYGLSEVEKRSRIFRRSLFVTRDMRQGEDFTEENVRSIRPADGLSPKYLKAVLRKKARKGIKLGTPLDWDLMV